MNECILCLENKQTIPFEACTCNFQICIDCLTEWNKTNLPQLKCPMCRRVYAEFVPIQPRPIEVVIRQEERAGTRRLQKCITAYLGVGVISFILTMILLTHKLHD